MKPGGYWFRKKVIGWGWGLPLRWQGWAVMAVFVAGLAISVARVPPHLHPVLFPLSVGALIAAFTAVAWMTGEPLGKD